MNNKTGLNQLISLPIAFCKCINHFYSVCLFPSVATSKAILLCLLLSTFLAVSCNSFSSLSVYNSFNLHRVSQIQSYLGYSIISIKSVGQHRFRLILSYYYKTFKLSAFSTTFPLTNSMIFRFSSDLNWLYIARTCSRLFVLWFFTILSE